jgi:hypothetical protein
MAQVKIEGQGQGKTSQCNASSVSDVCTLTTADVLNIYGSHD